MQGLCQKRGATCGNSHPPESRSVQCGFQTNKVEVAQMDLVVKDDYMIR